jgi:hypothetical protein
MDNSVGYRQSGSQAARASRLTTLEAQRLVAALSQGACVWCWKRGTDEFRLPVLQIPTDQ